MAKEIIEEGIRFTIGDHGKVTLPGIGAFTGQYVSARFDSIEGTISPPTMNILLDPKVRVAPTLMIEYISSKLPCSYIQAKELLEAYASDLAKKLKTKEIVAIDGVGRLYIDFKGELQFVQDNGNRLFQSFGLPTLEFQPIHRAEKKILPNPVAAKEPAMPSLWVRTQNIIASKEFMPISLGAGIFFIILSLFLILPKQKIDFADQLVDKRIQPERINTKPSHQLEANLAKELITPEQLAAEELKLEKELEDIYEETKIPATDEEEIAISKTEKATRTVVENEAEPTDLATLSQVTNTDISELSEEQAIIIIGVYSQQEGILMRKQQVEALGYTFYSDGASEKTRVGLVAPYSSQQQLNEILTEIKRDLNAKAWVLK